MKNMMAPHDVVEVYCLIPSDRDSLPFLRTKLDKRDMGHSSSVYKINKEDSSPPFITTTLHNT